MGLYLCIYDQDVELEGLEIGTYDYFDLFRRSINDYVENNDWGSVCPTIMMHSDCDGEWNPQECELIISEIELIESKFQKLEINPKIILCKKEIFNLYGIKPENLYDCFVDVDGENLIDRLKELCKYAAEKKQSILFQ